MNDSACFHDISLNERCFPSAYDIGADITSEFPQWGINKVLFYLIESNLISSECITTWIYCNLHISPGKQNKLWGFELLSFFQYHEFVFAYLYEGAYVAVDCLRKL